MTELDDRKWATDVRVIERKNAAGWEVCRMQDLKPGDEFRFDDHAIGGYFHAIADSIPTPELKWGSLDEWTWGIDCRLIRHTAEKV